MVLVSINCTAYNHEKYIAKAIESFLNQKTNFEYEILIHDDASTDKTCEIIKEYEKKYPKIIKPIYQLENQYSKGIKVWSLNTKRARGKYIAICEGDDYWVDPYKLQKQVDYMEDNPNCTMCFHNAEIINEKGSFLHKTVIDTGISSRVYTAGELAVLGFIPTASRLYIKSVFDNPPSWYEKAIVADFPSQLIISSYGYAYYMNEIMSVYRSNSIGSATSDFNKKSLEEKLVYLYGFIEILNEFNKHSNYRYTKDIEKAVLPREIQIIELSKNFKKLKDIRYRDYLKSLNNFTRIKLFLRMYFRGYYMKITEIKTKMSLVFRLFRRKNG